VRSNISQRITLEDLAAVAGYSRFHFVRAFKDSTGVPPYAYVLRERVAAARGLLDHSALPIAEIAQRCGFSTHTHFSTRFREAIGLTPADYRRRAGGGDNID
ncbi:MAG: helix-turn-helix transcriptional regulator, partial [Sphingomonas sp.]|nr:helix-turn-helix transcriptional regulator [Sphingomonas sp.]